MNGNYKTITEFAAEVERIEKSKNDFLVPTSAMEMYNDNKLDIQTVNGIYDIGDIAHEQIAARLGIPKKYYDAMPAIPGLRTTNVNEWLRYRDEKRLVRTLDDRARAFLSDKFKPMDNWFMLQAIMPTLQKYPDIRIQTAGMTERRMYMQCMFPSLKAAVRVGDPVCAGVTITNSEVGMGALDIKSMVWTLSCTNGAIYGSVLRKFHVGRRLDGNGDGAENIFRNDTLKAELAAYKLQMRDVFDATTGEKGFGKTVEMLRAAAGEPVDKPKKTVENVTVRFGLSDEEGDRVLGNLIGNRDVTRWGLSNAVTALAHGESVGMDRQYEYERIGADIVTLSPKEWEVLN